MLGLSTAATGMVGMAVVLVVGVVATETGSRYHR
jgi:hypothetical protein